MGIGRASGDSRALDATRQAIASPLLEVNINGAQGILFNIAGSSNLSLFEVTEAAEEIRSVSDPEANIIFGTSFNERLGDEVMITVIATGFDGRRRTESARATADRHGSASSLRSTPSASSGTPVPARDFLEELERQRTATESETRGREEAVVAPVRQERAPEPPRRAASYDADDLEIPSFLRKGR